MDVFTEERKFFKSLHKLLQTENLDCEENIICGGDFNCLLNPKLDKTGGVMVPRKMVIYNIRCLQNEWDLVDIWRIKNPQTKSYTWSQRLQQIFCRLDYWLVSNNLQDFVISTYIIRPTVGQQSAEEVLKRFHDEKAKGIIIRARARWHEHGERSSKYFLNLENRNNVKKTYQKLLISGAITTDPFKTLKEQKNTLTTICTSHNIKIRTANLVKHS